MRSTTSLLIRRSVRSLPCVFTAATQVRFSSDVPSAVAIQMEPEFEGEAPATSSTKAPEESAAPAQPLNKLPHNYSAPPLKMQSGGLRRLNSHDRHEIEQVYEAYLNYFNHMKFRKNWEEPEYDRETCRDNWMLAAEYVVRIRIRLDEMNPGQKLRMRDGAAQDFFHSPEASKLGDGTSFEFLVSLVHATLRDAVGYVEGLNKAKVNQFIQDITEYRYNPKMHAQHVLQEVQGALNRSVTKADTPEAIMEMEVDPMAWKKREDGYYLDTDLEHEKDDPADAAWRSGIGKLYEALNALEKAEGLMKKKFVQPPPSQ